MAAAFEPQRTPRRWRAPLFPTLTLRGDWWDSNPRPPEPQPGALPTELQPPCSITNVIGAQERT